MREGSGHGLSRVGSDFLSAIAGRVNVSPGRAGSKKSDPWTTLPWTTLDPNGEFTTFSKTYYYRAEFGWDRNVVCLHFRQILRSATGGKIKMLKRLNYIHQIARFQV